MKEYPVMDTTPPGGVQSWLSDWLDEPIQYLGMIVTRRTATQLAFDMDEGEDVVIDAGEQPKLEDVHPDDIYTYIEATNEIAAEKPQVVVDLTDWSIERMQHEFSGTPMGSALELGLMHSDT